MKTTDIGTGGNPSRRRGPQVRQVTLGDVAAITMGQSPPGSTVSAQFGLPLLNGPTEFGLHHPLPAQFTAEPRKRAQLGDLLFCVRGSTTGRMNWADQEYAIGRGIAAIRHLNDPNLQPVVRGVIEANLQSLLAQATGSTFPNVSASLLANIPYPILGETEEAFIAHVLGSLDDKIELNRQINETLEQMARALYKSWFVDFDPVRAKLDGLWRRGESLPGLPAELYDLFPDRLVASELGEIPEGWEANTIADLATIEGGSTPSTKIVEYWEQGTHCWATPKDLSGLTVPVLLETNRKITDAGLGKIGSGLQPPGTVLLSSRAPVGYLAINEVPTAINQGFIAIRPKSGIPNHYLLHWCADSLDEILNHANGSTFLEISKSSFRSIRLAKPNHEVLEAYEGLASNFYQKIVDNEQSNRILIAIRDSLLPELISGGLRVQGSQRA